MTELDLLDRPLAELLASQSLAQFVREVGNVNPALRVAEWIQGLSQQQLNEAALERETLAPHLLRMWQEVERMQEQRTLQIGSLTLLPGVDKQGRPEAHGIRVCAGEIVSIVGPTGAGKSSLLADIEALVQGDSPTRRCVLLNDAPVTARQRHEWQHRLVAQLSQNMNFVVDLSVREFLTLHARCRMVESIEIRVEQVIACANSLTGETFTGHTPLTRLSGGQSRALMIADAALLGAAPVVLIDEIENAGVDRQKALSLLVSKEKIVFLSTHDPLLALRGGRRLVIRNGGMAALHTTSAEELACLHRLEELEATLLAVRHALREGQPIRMT